MTNPWGKLQAAAVYLSFRTTTRRNDTPDQLDYDRMARVVDGLEKVVRRPGLALTGLRRRAEKTLERFLRQPRHGQIALEDPFLWQVRVEFHEQLVVTDDLAPPILVIDGLQLRVAVACKIRQAIKRGRL